MCQRWGFCKGLRLPLGTERVGSECLPYFANGVLQKIWKPWRLNCVAADTWE